ncbi:MAG: serine/threonine protein kinase, partial [Myxococcales bacterium]|nr:serine/threonine protein kinase [Myxococcales bacterium]
LKPANLFVMADGNAKVLDFGIGALPADEQGLTLTRTGMVLGTPLYMAPEQITAVSRPDARSDQYALGVVLYKGLTGRLPFQAENYTALAVKIAVDVPIPPRELRPEIPPALEDAVLRAIARKPEERFDSVRDFAAALEPFGSKSVAHAKESTPSEAAPSTPIPAEPVEPEPVSMTPSEAQPLPLTRVPRWAIAVAALALLGLVAFGVGLAGPFDDADPVVPAPATTPPTAPAPEPAAAIAAPLPVPEPAPAAPAAEPTPEEEEPVPASPPSPRATSRTSRRTARSSGEAPTVPEPSSGRRVPHVDEAEF